MNESIQCIAKKMYFELWTEYKEQVSIALTKNINPQRRGLSCEIVSKYFDSDKKLS